MSLFAEKNNLKKKEVIFIAPTSALRQPKRFAKMVPMLRLAGYGVTYLGWERIAGDLENLRWDDQVIVEKCILRGGGYVSRRARAMYPLWMLMVFVNVLSSGRHRTFLCLGWETAFPAVIGSFFTGSKVIFDDGDRFSMILRLPGPLHKILQRLERWTSNKSFLHLIPGWSRYQWREGNMLLLQNTPSMSDFESAARKGEVRPDADLVIYANGWIGHTRGAPIFLDAMKQLESFEKRIVMIVAGRVDSDDGRNLIKHKNVVYKGEVTSQDALGIYPVSDVVLTYYDPTVEINRYAESNKWSDCVYSGVPFIVNSEVVTAVDYVRSEVAWSIEYTAVADLVNLLKRLSSDLNYLNEYKKRMIEFKNKASLFDDQFKGVMGFLETIGD